MKKHLLAISAAAVLLAPQAVGAEGFSINEWSAEGFGMGGARMFAENDAANMAYNPAAMTKIEGQKAKVSLAYIAPHGKWEADNVATGQEFNGRNRVNPALVPGMYYVKQLNDTEWLGMATYTRFGNMCQFERDSLVGTNAFSSRLNGVSLGMNYAKKLDKKLSASVGAEINYVGLVLDKNLSAAAGSIHDPSAKDKTEAMINAGIAAGKITREQVAAYQQAADKAGQNLLDGKGDTPLHIKGESVALGWNAALNYEFDDKNEVGVVYRSKVKHSMEADYDMHGFGAFWNGGHQYGDAYGCVTLPESWMLGYGHKFDEKTRMEFNATWTRWSRFDAFWMNVDPAILNQTTLGGVKNWKDGWRYAIGIEHKLSDKYSLLAGMAHDERGIPDETGDFMVPTGERDTYTLGIQYHDKKQTIAASFGYMDVGDMRMHGHGADAYKNAKMYDSYTKIVVLSYQYNF
ncbi:OmpP1/FadL family transporter [Phascolarctobacterium sp.]|uniref:OmpP1/FadL family transporter n=1 Tax=Phascolarctobacterium sp. TaxID=2049039 RepID=UPI00386FD1C4